MTLNVFILSILASGIATIIVGGAVYKLINKTKIKKTINQKGKNNNAIMDSKINIDVESTEGRENE